MSNEISLEFIKLSHFNWITKIELFLEDKTVKKEDIVINYSNSEIVQWFQYEVRDKIGFLPEVQFLVLKYKKLYEIAQFIWDSKNDCDTETAQVLFSDFLEVTRRMLNYYENTKEIIFEEYNRKGVINFN